MNINQSSKSTFYLFKYIFLLLWLVIVVFVSLSFYHPSIATINKEPMSDTARWITLIISSIILPFLFFYIRNKLVIVTVDSKGFKISQKKAEKRVDWEDIEYINQISLVMPPLYRLKTKTGEPYLFPTKYQFAASGGIVKDLSQMGYTIRKNIRLHKLD